MKIRQGLAGGIFVALFSSVVVGVNAETFWGPFLTTLAVTLASVGVVIGLVVLGNRGQPGK